MEAYDSSNQAEEECLYASNIINEIKLKMQDLMATEACNPVTLNMTIQRKNSLFFCSDKGERNSAIYIISTCKNLFPMSIGVLK